MRYGKKILLDPGSKIRNYDALVELNVMIL